MTILARAEAGKPASGLPLLASGDRMKQPEFHRRYEQYPGNTKFELIGGIVYMASPARWLHGQYHNKLGALLSDYSDETPGTGSADEATAILSEESEPQPDVTLRIQEGFGGQSHVNAEGYIEGPPELLAEVAYSSRAIDLGQKREYYQREGVLEYLVLSIEDQRLFWFHFPSNSMIEADNAGILRSIVFPGLWIHEEALLARDMKRAKSALRKGLASKAHRSFVSQLAKKRKA